MILIDVFVAARKAQGLSQPKLAKLAGVSQQLIGEIEKGRVKSTKAIYRLATALGRPASEIDPDIPALSSEMEEQLIEVSAMEPEEVAFVLRSLKDIIKVAKRKPKLVTTNDKSESEQPQPAGRKGTHS